MAINASDPDMLVLFTMDETNANADRVSEVDAAHILKPLVGSYVAGPVPTLSDGLGGKCADLTDAATRASGTYSNTDRHLGQMTAFTLDDKVGTWFPSYPRVSTDGFGIGIRFKCTTYGAWLNAQFHHLAGIYKRSSSGYTGIDIAVAYHSTYGFRPAITVGEFAANPDDSDVGWTVHAGAWFGANAYQISAKDDDQWYSMHVYVQDLGDDTNARMWYHLYKEGTSSYVIAYKDVAYANANWNIASSDSAVWYWTVGHPETIDQSPNQRGSDTVDYIYLTDRYVTPDEVTQVSITGISREWVKPTYEVLDNKVRVAWTNERTTFPPTRALPTGATAVHHPAGSYGTRPRLRYEGFEPNRPWAVRLIQMIWDSGGNLKGKQNNRFTWDKFDHGLIRVPGQLPLGAMSEVRNMEFSGMGARRRRGFEVVTTDAAGTIRYPRSFFSFRSTSDQLHRLVLSAGTLYQDVGGSALQSISTGWSYTQLPSYVHFRDRCAILQSQKRSMWDGATEQDFDGEAAPTGGSLSLTTGTLDGTFAYAYTFYDPTSGDETAPKELGSASPSTQGVLLSSLDTSPTEARFTKQRIYRTVAGGASPDYFLTASQNNAATYTDSGDANGTIALDNVGGVFTTLVPPESFQFGVAHAGRVFYAGGTNGDRVYRSEAGTLNRFQADAYTAHNGPVRALVSRGAQLVVFTDRGVEIVESDWIRDSNGSTFETITEISNTVGCPGHKCVVDANDEIYWIDQRGLYTLRGDRVEKLSPLLDNVFRYLNWGLASKFVGGWNHVRNQLWFCLASAEFQDVSTDMSTQLVYQLGSQQFSLYDLNASWCGQYDDDLNGIKFGIMDEFGIWKEMEGGESDGLGNNVTVAAKHTGAIDSISGAILTDAAQTWTVNEFKGYGLVLRDATDGALHYYTIISNTATTLTVDRPIATALGLDDAYYIGGIKAFFELAEAQMGSTNRKLSRQLHTELDDLTRGDNI